MHYIDSSPSSDGVKQEVNRRDATETLKKGDETLLFVPCGLTSAKVSVGTKCSGFVDCIIGLFALRFLRSGRSLLFCILSLSFSFRLQ
jgi:hypothetical protein